MPKPSKVLIIGSGPIVIGQAGLVCLVDDLASALNFTEEGKMAGIFILFQGIANGLYGCVGIHMCQGKELSTFHLFHPLEVIGDDGKVNITPLTLVTMGIRAIENDLLHPNMLLEFRNELSNYMLDVNLCLSHENTLFVCSR